MWEPVGPLPAGVYWRRRCVAIASTLGTVVVVSWLIAALLTPARSAPLEAALAVATQSDGQPTEQAAPESGGASPNPAAAPALPTTPSAPAVVAPLPPAPAPPPVTPNATTQPRAPAVAQAPTTTERYGFGPSGRGGRSIEPASTEQLLPDDNPRRTGPTSTPVALPSTGPAPCPDAALAVTTEVDPQVHRITENPVLRLVVTNVSAHPCLRDLDAARQEIVVWGVDGARLWSSNDCSRAAGVDLRTLVPGQPAVFAVTWVGRTSAPGCQGTRTGVPVGTYNVMTRVDDVISPPVPVVRTP
ncbi:hypothetical protein [Pseudonocardia humida]|uniref:MucR family transcriptional regulator n=1 Tax=Pseudonocardia humida TaxID=2800819 RepID=A0ABT0ZWZ0_9PSEU|nr:hypothetical protein [Pseudonocardia humida]MCO1655188.1 hypothetical protein [Pseudonocardia humida]